MLSAQNASVSFSTDIAPVLLESCRGCHIGGQQASGGFRMDSYAALMRGGGSGAVVIPGQAADSLIVRKLTGEASGQRMPAGGRPTLSQEKMDLIIQWIGQGAPFDGPSMTANIQSIVNRAKASNASHAELFEQRKRTALERWKQAVPDSAPATSENNALFAIGNVAHDRLSEILEHFQHVEADWKKQAKLPADEPLVRGGLVLFVLKSRYDYSEFGRMVEKRELPREWYGHWHFDLVDVNLVLSDDRPTSVPLTSWASQLIAGTYWGSKPEVPYWFAEGLARNFVATKFRRVDPRVNQWLKELPAARQRISSASELVEGKVDEETVGLIGMAITQSMMSRANRPVYQTLIKHLSNDSPFPEAMTLTFGDPEAFIKSWLGK